jgi:ABC-type Zn uptake system ZnuABC Zn-binding protein ZnuA
MRSLRPRSAAFAVLLFCLPALVASACSKSDSGSTGRGTALADVKPVAAGRQLSVVGTTTQVTDFLRNVGGDRITVVSLVAANQDAHEFEPKPADVQKLNSAGIVFKNGAGLESGFVRFLNGVPSSIPIIDTSRGVALRTEGKTVDPHIWQDPQNATIMVDNIRDALAKRDPANAAVYRQNAAVYTQQLDQLDGEIRRQVDTVPPANRKLVTNHDAFSYYAARYGISVVGSVIPSLDTNSEPSAKDTEDLIKKIKAQHVCAIFTESSVNPKLEQQIAADAGVKIFSNLYGDSLGPPGSDGDTYLKAETTNTRNIVAGMAC